jgi:transcription termination factor NusB
VVYNVSTVFKNVSNLKDIKKEQQEAVKGILEAATKFTVTVNNQSDDRLVNVLTKMTDAVLRIASAPVKVGATTASPSPNSLYGRNTVQG